MLNISDTAKLVDRHPRTLRAYEKAGVIPRARRDPIIGWRVYDREDISRIRRILRGEKEPIPMTA